MPPKKVDDEQLAQIVGGACGVPKHAIYGDKPHFCIKGPAPSPTDNGVHGSALELEQGEEPNQALSD